jgi:hypothetical protein
VKTAGKQLNYTTKIPARRTVQECMTLLADAGADAVAAQYREKQPVGLSFQLETPLAGVQTFAMPVNVDGVQRRLAAANAQGQLRSDGHSNKSFLTREHALNVAWRVIRDWLEAQLAIIAAELVSLDEVMLPYLQVAPSKTLYQAYLDTHGHLELGG